MKKKILFGILAINTLLMFVSCGNLLSALKEPYFSYDSYESKPYINGVLVQIDKSKVENATSFVLFYEGKEVVEFEDSIFIPSDPKDNYNSVTGYSICAKNKKHISDPEKLNIASSSYILRTDYDVVLTQKSETYDSITFEWKLVLPDNLKFYDLENSELKCLIGDSHYNDRLSEMKGDDIGNNQVLLSDLKPATIESSLYGCLIYSYTDLMGVRHKDIVTELNSQKGYKGHTKALDKIENFSVTAKRTSAEVSFTELTDEQLHGVTDCEYMVLVTNKDDSEEKPSVKWLSKDETTGKYLIKGLKPDTNYQFELFAAEYSSFAEFADMATVEAKTAEELPAPKAPTITASDSYDENLKTSFTVEFEKHPYDTTEHPMEYQVEYYLFKTTSPETASSVYFKYPADGKVTVSNINTGNTYKVILKAREINDTASVISTDVQSVKTKITESGKYDLQPSEFTSNKNVYNWGIMTGTNIKNNSYFKFDVSSLYEYNFPKILVINADTSSTFKLNYIDTKMGHFEIYALRPDGIKASALELKNVTSSSYLATKSAEYVADLCGNFILDSYVYNDSIYLCPALKYSTLYDSELTDDYKVGITFVTNPSSL